MLQPGGEADTAAAASCHRLQWARAGLLYSVLALYLIPRAVSPHRRYVYFNFCKNIYIFSRMSNFSGFREIFWQKPAGKMITCCRSLLRKLEFWKNQEATLQNMFQPVLVKVHSIQFFLLVKKSFLDAFHGHSKLTVKYIFDVLNLLSLRFPTTWPWKGERECIWCIRIVNEMKNENIYSLLTFAR